MNPAVSIESVVPSDAPELLALLTACGLPQDGFSDHLSSAFVARSDQVAVGSAALELYGTAALLRSVAVRDAFRGRGVGRRLIKAALKLAKQKNVRYVYLLTQTAGDYFPRFGFRPIDRSSIPAAVRSSVEFTSACPASALAMELCLENDG